MFKHMIVLFTGAEDLEHDGISLKEYVDKAPPGLKKILKKAGNRYLALSR
jgi:hypothetical protein